MELWTFIAAAIALGLMAVVILALLFVLAIRAILKEAHRVSQEDWMKEFE